MEASILIVTRNRKEALRITLSKLSLCIDKDKHEVLVFMDGCTDNTYELRTEFDWVKWESSEKSIGASRARRILYPLAQGDILFGFDDDAHPLQLDFVERTLVLFKNDPNLGIIAFKEVRGVFENDVEALKQVKNKVANYYCNTFVGCGFAILKSVYSATNGFPEWMDIYGEEDCVAIETLALNKVILFTTEIVVNHRIDLEQRTLKGRHYFRFEKQLKNETAFYLIYYKYPLKALVRLYYHNFRTYALKDWRYFIIYIKVIGKSVLGFFKTISFRRPVSREVIVKRRSLLAPGL